MPNAPAAARARPDDVYLELHDLIVHGVLGPGSPLVEADLADRLAVSRTPVSHALGRLHQQGLIVEAGARRQSRYRVAPLTRDDGRALYQVIAELDGLAAHDAALLPARTRRRIAAALRETNRRMTSSTAREKGTLALYQLDRDFHRGYVEAGGSPRLRSMYRSLEGYEERYARVYYVSFGLDAILASGGEHDAIVAALSQGDAERAREAARANWRRSAERLTQAIERLGERGEW